MVGSLVLIQTLGKSIHVPGKSIHVPGNFEDRGHGLKAVPEARVFLMCQELG